jgi:TonB family protein
VKEGARSSPAYLRFYDKQRDLCQLHATGAASFTRPVRGLVAMDDLKVGQRVYAIGGPQGFELTLSEGLISGLRRSENGFSQLIQTTAAISPGSSGGGLFDQDGRLVGITTFLLEESQNLNFALPAGWVLELPSRQADLIGQPQPATPRAGLTAPPLRAAPKSSSIDEDAALKRYARDVSRIIGKSTSESDYPQLARQNGWEGTPEVRLVIGADGRVKNVLIATGSDYAILDERAVEMVKQVPLPKIPSVFREREFSITVPIAFTLRKP